MSKRSTSLFHTRISSLLNLHRITPQRVLNDVLSHEIPLASMEGFVRQIMGWREFVRHVHEITDGFRNLPSSRRTEGGDRSADRHSAESNSAQPSLFGADHPLLPTFWGSTSGLFCLDRVISDVWREGYSHHITRLMVLSNLATLLEISPRQLTDWFWCAYTDAYDWVVEPNVLGMGTFALGDLFTTKPYVSGSAYIKKMSDYCSSCSFDPDKTCPITSLYWAFLHRHRDHFKDNPRMRIALASLKRRAPQKRQRDGRVFEAVRNILMTGEELRVEMLPV